MKKAALFTVTILLSLSANAGELKKSVTWENIRNHPAPLPVIGEIAPIHSSLDRPSLWSVGSETLDRDFADFDKYVEYMGDTGVGYARLQSGWAKSEPKVGKYNFAWIDHQVDGLLAQGIRPWICLCYGNPAYTDLGYDLNAGIFGDGPVMDGWLKYVRQVVKRYKGKVLMYEVWNEPDGAKGPDGKKGTNYKEYANLFIRTATVIKEVDPDAKVSAIGALSIKTEYVRKVLESIKEMGGEKYLDFVTYHAYFTNPDNIREKVTALKENCRKINPCTIVLQGECGCPAQLEYGHALSQREWTEYSQAKWELRNTLVNFSFGIPYSVFTMVDLNYGWMLQSFGLIRMNGNKEPVYKRPKYYAIQHLTSVVGAEYTADNGLAVTAPSSSNPISLIGMKKDGRTIGYFMWFNGEDPGNSLEREYVNLNVNGVVLEDPVYVDMLTGYVHDISRNLKKTEKGMSYNGLPLWDSPVLIIERSELKTK